MDNIFDLSGPPLPELIEGVDYFPNEGTDPLQFQKGNKVSVGNKGNKNGTAPLGNTNRQLKYWYKTPLGEGIANGKKELVKLGFPPSIQARKDRHYIGGTSSRNHAWKGYEFKTLT